VRLDSERKCTTRPATRPSKAQRKSMPCEPGATMLKLFRNIPKADLEMLFPNTQLKMRTTSTSSTSTTTRV
jgi:hypothetical protein